MINLNINKKLLGVSGEFNLEVNIALNNNEIIALYGPSGSGKTTFLKILSGLEKSNSKIVVDGKIWQDEETFLLPQKRDIGFVFQDYALFPNMSVKENLLYAKNDRSLAKHLLKITELKELQDRKPDTLSGGQKQRVSLCRALMRSPKILLLDEPLSALDSTMRAKLQDELLSLHKEFGTTTILVSHDQTEVFRLCNRVLVLENGKIVKDGTPIQTLLKTTGSQKFSFVGELLDIKKIDVVYVAIISINNQLTKIVISEEESKKFKIGQKLSISTKAFLVNASE
ncbi:MAG: ATP-binding cassette domain-containing protein [Campylobacteraceae bacterium]|nr:ATP-binding cassette domain-containing protein [Campylobacteraceae bacterium]